MHQLPVLGRWILGLNVTRTMKVTQLFQDLIKSFEVDLTKFCSIGMNMDIKDNRSTILTQLLIKSATSM